VVGQHRFQFCDLHKRPFVIFANTNANSLLNSHPSSRI
jgi:hypothetical protein